MSRKIISVMTLLACVDVAGAADLRALPPQVVVLPSWTGFHIGINGGFTETLGTSVNGTAIFGNQALIGGGVGAAASAAAVNTMLGRRGGGLVGGQIGYDWQFERFVIGVETDFDAAFVRQTSTTNSVTPLPGFPNNPISGTVNVSQRLDNLGTVRGRFGILATPTLLVYATGGVAYGTVSSKVTIQQNGNSPFLPNNFGTMLDASAVRFGAVVGGGLEWKFAPSWSLKGEGLYYDIGSSKANGSFSNFSTVNGGTLFTTTGASSITSSRGYVARAGINYSFDTSKVFGGLF